MHLFPHLFESLLALFGSSRKHALTLHRTFVERLLQLSLPAAAVNSLETAEVHLGIVCVDAVMHRMTTKLQEGRNAT